MILVCLDPDMSFSAGALEAFAHEIFERCGDLVRTIAVMTGSAEETDLIGIPVLHDPQRAFAAAYAAVHGTVLVIRSDGCIGYRDVLSNRAELDAFLHRTVLPRKPESETMKRRENIDRRPIVEPRSFACAIAVDTISSDACARPWI